MTKGVFINLSNHPSDRWSEKQKACAVHPYTCEPLKIVDLPFPEVDPEANTTEIYKLARKYLDKILLIIEEQTGELSWLAAVRADKVVVHVMGEMGFTYRMVSLLKEKGFLVVHSTTHRIVEEKPDGTKISRFEFVQFREY